MIWRISTTWYRVVRAIPWALLYVRMFALWSFCLSCAHIVATCVTMWSGTWNILQERRTDRTAGRGWSGGDEKYTVTTCAAASERNGKLEMITERYNAQSEYDNSARKQHSESSTTWNLSYLAMHTFWNTTFMAWAQHFFCSRKTVTRFVYGKLLHILVACLPFFSLFLSLFLPVNWVITGVFEHY